jgi:1-acyl-sn-glycerol-3-phosphate acyltransferase
MNARPRINTAGPGFLLNLWHAIGLAFWRTLFCFLNRVEIIHPENIPRPGEEGIVLLYNHRSAIDPFLVAATGMPYFSSVWWRAPAKEQLHRLPVLKQILESWGSFPVRRGKRDFVAIADMVEMLKNSVLVIAPEGRRSIDGRLLPGRSGVGKIIHDARPRKVIPVALKGVDRILPKGRILPAIGKKTTVIYGKPLDLEKYYQQENSAALSQLIVDEVMTALDRLLTDELPEK